MAQAASHGTQLSLLSKCGLLSDQTPAQTLLPEMLIFEIPSQLLDFKW
jgi:hypothetical protein